MNTSIPQINAQDHMQSHWTDFEKENVSVVVDFFQNLMNAHDFDYTLKKYRNGSYLQHNRAIPNEIKGLVGYVKNMTKRYPEYSFNVKRITADGPYVILHSHTTLKAKHRNNEKKGFIITDTFKLEKGKLVEHWDAIQPIDTLTRLLFLMIGGDVKNTNPTF